MQPGGKRRAGLASADDNCVVVDGLCRYLCESYYYRQELRLCTRVLVQGFLSASGTKCHSRLFGGVSLFSSGLGMARNCGVKS